MRNPMAVINSARDLQYFSLVNIRAQCDRMQLDWKIAQWLKSEYPDRVHIIKYEDLALDILSEAKAIYKFVGMELPEEVVQHLRRKEKAAEEGSRFSTFRNANHSVHHWEQDMHPGAIDALLPLCLPAMRTTGYEKETETAERISH
jgi:hypothetical protein